MASTSADPADDARRLNGHDLHRALLGAIREYAATAWDGGRQARVPADDPVLMAQGRWIDVLLAEAGARVELFERFSPIRARDALRQRRESPGPPPDPESLPVDVPPRTPPLPP